jgi:hypothetical protein
VADKIIAKVQDTQQLRKELQEVKKLARERAKAITIRIPQLKDCKLHFDMAKGRGKGSMIFLTEGQSAAGSIVSCRDVNTQAIFVLKGKPLNVWDLQRDIVYKNDEMYNLMRSLDIEDNLENLRYEKVILATDADVDGLHIRNLLITYFSAFSSIWCMTGISTFWRRRFFERATRRRPFIVTAKRSGTRRRPNLARHVKSRVSRVWAKFLPANSNNSSAPKCA